MFSRLFSRRAAKSEIAPVRVPPGSRIYAIGDVHGCVELLRKLRSMIVEDAAGHPDVRKVIVYLGDYIDRGLNSRAVIDLLIDEPLPGFEAVFLRGNHEDSLLRFLDDPEVGPSWLTYGGDATLYSYGVRPPDSARPDELLAAQKELAQSFPAAHLDFFRKLKLMHIEGDYAFVHAGFRENIPIDRQEPEDMLWIRDEFLQSQADFGKVAVHGHSIAASPVVRRNRIGIDTGAFATGILTCVVLEGTDRTFLAT